MTVSLTASKISEKDGRVPVMAEELSGLAKKYSGFIKPCYEIIINGTDLKKECTLDDFKLELTAKYEASSLSFTIKNAFRGSEDFTAKMDDTIGKLVKLGNIIEASVGYGTGEKTKMFMGYIDSVYLEYKGGNEFAINVECLDAKGLMMNSFRSEVKKDLKKYSEAVKNILDNYPELIKKQTLEEGHRAGIIEQHNESDYDFVVKLAREINYSFYILNGEAVFKSNGKDKKTAVKIKKGRFLKHFSLHMSLKDQVSKVIVRSGNEKDHSNPFEGTADKYRDICGGQGGSIDKVTNIISKKVARLFIIHSVTSNDDAKKMAEAKLADLSYSLIKARLGCVGVPELMPGNGIELTGFGAGFDKTYYISKASHIINDDGYITECELEANVV